MGWREQEGRSAAVGRCVGGDWLLVPALPARARSSRDDRAFGPAVDNGAAGGSEHAGVGSHCSGVSVVVCSETVRQPMVILHG